MIATTDPMAVVEALLDAFARMNFPEALAYIASDAEYTNIPRGTVRGPEGVRAALEPFFAPIRENEFRILRKAVAGPVVFVERLDRHRLDYGWRELPVTGVFEVHNGFVTVWRDYFDLATAARIHDPGAA